MLLAVCYSLAAQDPAYPVVPSAPQNITRAEYFINTDSGFGNGIAITITAAQDINGLIASINTAALPSFSTNRLFVRTKNAEGFWSITQSAVFVIDIAGDPAYPTAPVAPQNVTQAEYFINTDPGFGSGTAIPITAAQDINGLIASINTAALPSFSSNRLFVRTKNAEGFWSITQSAVFVIDIAGDPAYPTAPVAPQNVTQAEYFINTDPGFGSGTAIPITAAQDINGIIASINTSSLSAATTNQLFVRTKNAEGFWSITNISTFVVNATSDPVYPAAPLAPTNVTLAEYFIDTDPGFGNGVPITLSAGVDIANLNVVVDVNALAQGQHVLFVRSRSNLYSISNAVLFIKGSVLPLTWAYIRGEIKADGALISWGTVSESNTAQFYLEHSTDGIHFTTAGTLAAAGNSNTALQYSLLHSGAVNGLNYYRIKQTDRDGRFTYSPIVKILNRKGNGKIVIAPNPASNEVTIYFDKPMAAGNLRLYNSSGQMISLQRIAEGSQQQKLDVSKLPAGIYQLQVQTATAVETFKLMKQ